MTPPVATGEPAYLMITIPEPPFPPVSVLPEDASELAPPPPPPVYVVPEF